MRHIGVPLVVLVLTLTVGCAGLGFGLPTEPPRTPQDYINEGNILLTAIAKTVTSNVNAGTMTPAERDSVMDDWRKFTSDIDAAQTLLDSGKATEAQQRARIINQAIKALHKKVAAKAKEAMQDEWLRDRERDFYALGNGHEHAGDTRTAGYRASQWFAGIRGTGAAA